MNRSKMDDRGQQRRFRMHGGGKVNGMARKHESKTKCVIKRHD
jgi:hypothetical protein